jgi:putative CocE/NonD family hydrolase
MDIYGSVTRSEAASFNLPNREEQLMRSLSRLAVTTTAALTLLGTYAGASATAAPGPEATTAAVEAPGSAAMHWSPRPEDYPGTVTTKDLAIPMSDGITLRGDLTLPATADGAAVAGRFPVVVTITAYNKSVIAGGFGSTLAGADPAYLVKRGYAQLTVDARGTGSSPGQWCAFCTREDLDASEVMAWAHEQPWSNGDTAMTGASYMGISQVFAAAGRPPGLKAIFPQVPGADVYRDVVASGGQLDVGFIPLWLGLVTVTGLIPPSTPPSDTSPLTTLVDRLSTGGTFTLPLLLDAMGGGDAAYDGPFYEQRSPINVVDQVDVPAFFVSGEYDLFQRGTPLLFENLQKRGVPTKMIIGPWNHLQGSSGAEIGNAGYGSLAELQLRWFDHYVKGLPDPALDGDIPPVTYYEQGTGSWQTTQHWVGADRHARTYRLSGTATTGGAPGALTTGPAQDGTADVYPVPVSGLCTRSASQWTAGVPDTIWPDNPCSTNNAPNDNTGVVFRSEPVTAPIRFQGPINARLYVSSTSGDGMLSVAVEDEAPDGTVSRLSGGWQVISHRALDTTRSRYLDGQLVQPYHPFTQAAQEPLPADAVQPVDVEVFPTGASIEPGHRLRIAIQAFDVPHLLPSLPDALGSLTVIEVHNSAQYPSSLTIPALGAAPTVSSGATPRVASRTTISVKRPGHRHRAARIRVAVTTGGRAAAGRVEVRFGKHLLALRTLQDGHAQARVPARWMTRGVHRVTVRYRGTATVAPSTATTRWRVR